MTELSLRNDRRLYGRNRWRQAGAGFAAGDRVGGPHGHRQYRRRHRVVGAARLARYRFGAVRIVGPAQQGARLGQRSWFSLGDLDLATHLTRSAMLRAGKSLSRATGELASKMGIRARVLPMSDDRVSTLLDTAKGTLTFQEYFVRERHQVAVRRVRFEGAHRAHPAPGVIESVEAADAIIFAPSNPVTSIGPILAVPEIRDALRRAKATIAAVSPIVGGQ